MVLPKITAKIGYKNVTGHLVPTRGGSTGPVDIGRTHLVGAWTGKARFTMQAPPAKNAQVIMELGADGEIQHVSAAEEASKTEHEFYIVCAALSVRSIMLATCSLTSCYLLHTQSMPMLASRDCLPVFRRRAFTAATGALIHHLRLLRCGSTCNPSCTG